MHYTITGIREGAFGNGTERISHARLRNNANNAISTHTVNEVIQALLTGAKFSSQTQWGPTVEEVPRGRNAKYIRSDANGTASDNLLFLPRI